MADAAIVSAAHSGGSGSFGPRKTGKPIETGRLIVGGLLVIAIFFGAGLLWLGLAPLSSAAIAPGVVSVAGSRKTIQHLDGGIVREILIAESDRVVAGQALIQLDDTQLRSRVAFLETRAASLQALEVRLRAELRGDETMTIPPSLTAGGEVIRQIVLDQTEIFTSRQRTLEGQLGMLEQRIRQQQAEINGLNEQVAAARRLRDLVAEETELLAGLMASGLGTRTKLFDLRRDAAEHEESIVQQETQIAVARGTIEGLEGQAADLRATRRAEVAVELRAASDALIEIREQLDTARHALDRTTLRAPAAGRVVDLRIHTVGGVIEGGTPLLDIVPDDELVVEVRIDPKDRDVISSGMPAEVRFTAFNQRSSMPVKGQLVWISADRMIDDRTGAPHFLARVALTEDPSAALGGSSIFPGMQATAMIVTGERTALSYLLQPLTRTITGAFKEE